MTTTTTTLARPSDGASTRSIAVDARRRRLLATPAPSDREALIVLQWHAWGLPVDRLLTCFGAGTPLALPGPEHIPAPVITDLAVSVPLRDLGVEIMEERPVPRRSTEWTRRRRLALRCRSLVAMPDRWTRRWLAGVGVAAVVLLVVELHPWRWFAGFDWPFLALVGAPLVGGLLGVATFWGSPRRSS